MSADTNKGRRWRQVGRAETRLRKDKEDDDDDDEAGSSREASKQWLSLSLFLSSSDLWRQANQRPWQPPTPPLFGPRPANKSG